MDKLCVRSAPRQNIRFLCGEGYRHRMLSITGPWRPNKLLNNLFARTDSAIDFTSRKKTILILAFEDGSKNLNQFGIYVSFGPFFCHNLIIIYLNPTISIPSFYTSLYNVRVCNYYSIATLLKPVM